MSKVFDLSSVPAEPLRPDITNGVLGKWLLKGDVKAVLARVAPGGKSRTHQDKYGHLFYFLEGAGTVQVGTQQVAAKPGVVVQIEPGESHAYENTGSGDLVLISMNLPA